MKVIRLRDHFWGSPDEPFEDETEANCTDERASRARVIYHRHFTIEQHPEPHYRCSTCGKRSHGLPNDL